MVARPAPLPAQSRCHAPCSAMLNTGRTTSLQWPRLEGKAGKEKSRTSVLPRTALALTLRANAAASTAGSATTFWLTLRPRCSAAVAGSASTAKKRSLCRLHARAPWLQALALRAVACAQLRSEIGSMACKHRCCCTHTSGAAWLSPRPCRTRDCDTPCSHRRRPWTCVLQAWEVLAVHVMCACTA